MDWRRYRDAQREDSISAAKADILLDEIARREGIEARDGEVDAEVAPPRRAHAEVRRSRCALSMEKEGDLGRAQGPHPRGEDP